MSSVARLWTPDFRWWLGARAAAVLAAEIAIVVLQLLVLEDSDSALAVAALRVAVTLPYLLLGMYAGALADRTHRRRLMITCDLVAGSLLLLAALWSTLVSPSITLLLAVTFLLWSTLVFFEAGSWGSILAIVGRGKLGDANAKIWAVTSIAGLAGPVIAAWVGAATTLTVVLFLASGLYYASAGAVSQIKAIRKQGEGPPHKPRARDGLRLLMDSPVLRNVVGIASAASFAMGAATGVLVVLIASPSARDGGYLDVGLVFASGAAGALAASWAFPPLRRAIGTRALLLVGVLVYGAALTAFVLVEHVALVMLTWGIAHLIYTLTIVCAITVRQEATPAEEQGRVNTSARVVTLTMMLAGTLVGGLVADTATVQNTYYLAAAVVTLAGLAFITASWRTLGTIQPPTR
ncbi:MFS transporter [Serinicoccus marinus]|uniref:MFS transporter n=1 Tax=Serinicoccus marinus TaxID=247333 RepID=UPI00249138FC|nr:MFS transporter [Serinicoccus marinus]